MYVSCGEECEDVAVTEVREAKTDVTEESAPSKKLRLTLLEKLFGNGFEDQTAGTAAVSRREIVQAEISQYKGMPAIGLRKGSWIRRI